jgi:hypothetical protein
MRLGEMKALEWRDVDLAGRVVRLRPSVSKNKDGRVLPLSRELLEIVERANANHRLDCPYVFHLDGQPVGDFKRAWATACKRAGVGKVLVHDLRRTAVRNMVRAGIPDRVAMTLSGHKPGVCFDRYNIVSEADLAAAAERLQAHLGAQPVHEGDPDSGLPEGLKSCPEIKRQRPFQSASTTYLGNCCIAAVRCPASAMRKHPVQDYILPLSCNHVLSNPTYPRQGAADRVPEAFVCRPAFALAGLGERQVVRVVGAGEREPLHDFQSAKIERNVVLQRWPILQQEC